MYSIVDSTVPTAKVSKPPVPLPFHMQFVAGAIAGVSEILTMYPLDVGKGSEGYTGIVDCFRKIIKQEGFGRLYRGIAAPILVEAPKRATKFAANEQYSRIYLSLTGKSKMDQPLSVLTGVSAGITEAFVVVSFELVKIRMQNKANAGKYKSTLDCAIKIFQQEGPLAFFKGLESTVWRHAAWNGGYFGVIHGVREALPKSDTPQGILFRNFVAGTIGGTVGTIINTPFDVVKTRVQNQVIVPGIAPKYNWTLPALPMIVREEGFAAMYKGFLPKVLRLGPGGGILLVVFDAVSNAMRKMYLNPNLNPDQNN